MGRLFVFAALFLALPAHPVEMDLSYCGIGVQLALLLPPLMWICQRRRRALR